MKNKETTPPINTLNEQGKSNPIESINTQNDVQTLNETNKVENNKRPIEEARELLKSRSQVVKELVDSEMFLNINDALIETVYKDEANQEFKSYREWKKNGFQVRKGEKAFLLWGRPKEHQLEEQKNAPEQTDKQPIDDTYGSFFPVAYVFSNAQVDVKERQLEHEEHTTIKELKNIRHKTIDNDLER